ncbi:MULTISPECIES: permease [unclassified Devosia]|uniref:permease n=1 Tax=unclassified Devosia TaxID=196773 RepID=UPI001AC2397C|nr:MULTISPECIES: permease [unclassified Devosia]MBN9303749.1 permease [Devosia sp.]
MPWFAAHEARLMWRDGIAMLTGGYPARRIALTIFVIVVAIVLHLMANAIVGPWVEHGIAPDKATLVAITGTGFLFWTVMLSQALESVTRAYYSRADLDLILSSPASSHTLFAVRTGITAATTLLLACLLASPVVDVLVLHDGAHWLTAYLVLAALSALSTALAVLITVALFRLAGPRRTRLFAQIIAALVGAGFVIGIQAIAILHFGNMASRFALFGDPDFIAAMPPLDSLVWAPARAVLGDWPSLVGVVALGALGLGGTIAFAASSFGRHAIAAAGIGQQQVARRARPVHFRPRSQKQQLRVKEWKLLARDPWLLSQTLMQVLYLLPPALYLWISYGQSAGTYVVVIPVLVMATGQLSGGLSWLAISGEDAHDLVVTAPVPPAAVTQAKIEAVATVVLVLLAPIIILMLFASLHLAATTAVFAALSSGSATAIQLWFRVPMRRAMFRRRQVASRVSTIAEALSSIFWAGTAVLVAGDQYTIAALPGTLALVTLAIAWWLSPKGRRV